MVGILHLVLCFMWIFGVHTLSDNDKCVTPYGQEGQCVLITDCPVLLDAFANPIEGSEEYLFKFKCTNALEYKYYYKQDMFVCCGTSAKFTVFGNINSTRNESVDFTKLLRYCGYQHKDDYFSPSNDTITLDEFPWIASVLGRLLDKDNASLCSGTLINNKYVLTSAYGILSVPSWSYGSLYVRLGEYRKDKAVDCVYFSDWDLEECNSHKDLAVEVVLPHPFYNPKTGANNILLLRLMTNGQFSDFIRPLCLPLPERTLAKPNDVLYLSAVGSQWDYVGLSTMKIKSNASLITNEACGEAVNRYHKRIDSYLMCTTNLHNETSAAEYEGAPLMFRHKRQWHIEGIMVDRHFCSLTSTCLYIKVSEYLQWIQRTVRP